MGDNVYFEGDPETDSARRHMERVLKGEPSRRKWPWMAAALGGGGLWFIWQAGRAAARAGEATAPDGDTSDGPSVRRRPHEALK
jgi:hypothetical protein